MSDRGLMIQEIIRAMGQEKYLRQLAQQRDRRMAQKKRKQKKEADATAIATTSSDINNVKKPLNNYTKEREECQPSQSAMPTALPEGEPDCGVGEERVVTDSVFDERNTPGDSSDGEIRQQGCSELPVHLL